MSRAGPQLAWSGALLALLSALAFALNLTLVALVYQDGGNVHAVNLVRPACFALVLLVWLRAVAAPLLLPRGKRLAAVTIGALMCVAMYALLGAIAYIPVGLAVLLMYTYPMLLTLLDWLRDGQGPGPRRVLAMTLAFAGLALALQPPGATPDWRGVTLGVTTAAAFALMVWLSGRSMQGEDRRTVMLHAMLTTTLVVTLVTAAGAEPTWPASAQGWFALGGATLLFIASTFFLFTAIGLIGSLRTALVDNTSPVWAMLFAALLLGERLSTLQTLGAVLVMVSVAWLQLAEQRAARALPHP